MPNKSTFLQTHLTLSLICIHLGIPLAVKKRLASQIDLWIKLRFLYFMDQYANYFKFSSTSLT